MNHVYRLKYNACLGVWVAVSEITRAHGKIGRRIHSRVGAQRVLIRSLLILMTTGGLISAAPSWAACTGVGGTYTCSGVTTTTQTLNVPVLNVTADATYQNTGAGTNNGLNLTATTGSLTASQAAGSVINDSSIGISAQNYGTGSTTISTAGTVKGASAGGGIYAINAPTATDLTISQVAGSVISDGNGIGAFNNGTGSTTISTAGSVTGSTGINSYGQEDVTISQTAGAITATNNGIYVMNFAVGSTTVNLDSGTIHSNYLGISLENGVTTTGLTINQSADHTITSDNYAIQTTDAGAADTNITLAGTLSATTVGVNAIHYSTGALNIAQNGGSISGGSVAGVIATGEAAVNVTQNGGSISSATGTGVIIDSIFSNGPVSLTQNTGSISGNYGVVIANIGKENTILTQTAGNIVGTAGDGLYITNGLVFGNTTYAYGTDTAIHIAGTVSGTQNGISAYNYGSGQMDITSSGIISGAGTTASSAVPPFGVNNPVSGNGIYANNMTGATDLTIRQTAGVISGDSNGIEAINTGSGPTTVAVAGEVTGGTGAGIHTSGTAGAPVDITLNSGAKVSAASGVAINDDAANATLTMNGGSQLTGQVLMGEGNDIMSIKDSADISGVTLLDGGNSTDSTVTDILGTATAATNKLTFENSTNSLSGSTMKNWQTVTLDGSNITFTSDAALVTGTGINSDSSLQGLVIQNGATLNSPVTLDVTGDVSIDATSMLNHSQGGSITGNVTSAGLIDWRNTTAGQILTINGNYTGVSGSRLLLQTVLGDDSSLTDKLVVTGDTAGTTSVGVRNAGGTGAQTLNGIELIHINGTSNGVFTQAGRIVAGVYEYSLARGQGSNSSHWYLTNQKIVQEPSPTPTPEPNPTPEPKPTPEPNPGSDGPVINTKSEVKSAATLRPEINSYTENLAAANTLFNTRLHDRLGETQYIDVLTGEKKVTSMWLRQIGGHNNWRSGGGQLQTQSNRYVIQMGGDVAQWSTDDLDRLHLGLMMGYAHENNHTHSSVTGYGSKGSLDGYSVGAYATWYANDANHNGLYIDSWAQYGWFNNYVHGDELAQESYKSRGMTVSVESGYTYKLGTFTGSQGTLNEGYIRPVAQITWMGVKADDHREDNGTRVQGEGHGNIQTRLGLRTYLKSHNKMDDGKGREFQPFIEANWLHNTRNFATRMNGVSISQDGANNVGEIKLGVEGQLNPRLNLWGNVGVQVGDKGYNDSVAMVGVKVNF